jgi:hypothetical protein
VEPQDSADDQPEDTPQDEDTVLGDDVPAEGEQEPGVPDGDEEPATASPDDRPSRDGLPGFESISRDDLAGLMETIDKVLRPMLDRLARQQASWAKTFVIPKFDLPVMNFPVLDAAARQMSESVLAGIDFGKLLPKIDFSDLLKFEPAGGWERWRTTWWPPNWPRDIDRNAVQAILNDESLPLVWVPRAEIVTEMLAAATREERVAVLVARRAEVADDCRGVLADVDHPRLLGQRRLLTAAVDALANGHDEAAQALAVLVVETAVLQAAAAGHIDGVAKHTKLYERVKDAVRVNLDEAPVWLLRVVVSLAPVAGFFAPFFPHKGDPVPEGMSRHVTVHFAFDEHYTEEHAVVAVLLMASVVRGLQQGWESWEQKDGPENDAEGT